MSTPLRLVSADNLPNVQATLTNQTTGKAIDISDPATVVTVRMRALNGTAILATVQGLPVNTGTDGIFSFGFPGNALDVPAGQYEFEVSVSFNGSVETVYDTIKAQIRTSFAQAAG